MIFFHLYGLHVLRMEFSIEIFDDNIANNDDCCKILTLTLRSFFPLSNAQNPKKKIQVDSYNVEEIYFLNFKFLERVLGFSTGSHSK